MPRGRADAQDHAGESDPPLRLRPLEWLFLVLVILAWSALVISLGKDTSWDFRNYHWYIPYALLNGRLGFDVAVAHQATYYNPLVDVPFYLLAKHTTSWFALGVLGAVQGANIVPLYLIGRQTLRMPESMLGAMGIALLGVTGALALSLLGTTYYDNVMSVLTLSSLALLILNRHTLTRGSLAKTFLIALLAGFLCGSAVGLKLPEAPFALGFGATLLVIGGDGKHAGTRLAGGVLGGLLGVAVFAGFWFVKMEHLTGNPLFPYFNQYFHSTLALAAPYRDERFLPHGVWNAFLLPFRFTLDWKAADDLPFRDARVGLAYAATLIALIFVILRVKARDSLIPPRATRMLFAFGGITLIAWVSVFAIYRYILALEMLAPLVIAAAVGLLPMARRARLVLLGGLFLAVLVYARSDFLDRAPLGDPYIQSDMPKIPHPNSTLMLMTGDAPLGYLVTLLPPRIPVLRIDGWMMQPEDGTRLTREMRARVAAHKGDIYLLSDAYDMARAHDAVGDYGLSIDWLKCKTFESNLSDLYELCPLVREKPKS